METGAVFSEYLLSEGLGRGATASQVLQGRSCLCSLEIWIEIVNSFPPLDTSAKVYHEILVKTSVVAGQGKCHLQLVQLTQILKVPTFSSFIAQWI